MSAGRTFDFTKLFLKFHMTCRLNFQIQDSPCKLLEIGTQRTEKDGMKVLGRQQRKGIDFQKVSGSDPEAFQQQKVLTGKPRRHTQSAKNAQHEI